MESNQAAPARSHRFQVALSLAAALPVVLAVVFHARGAQPQPSPVPSDRPKLVFEQYLVNLGPVPPRRFVPARFTFTNTGDQTVRITDLKASCGCLNPRLEKREYAPGESGTFHLTVETPGETPGPKEYFVRVQYEDPQSREELLTFKVVLPEQQVEVHPRGLIFYQPGGSATAHNLTVTDYRARPLTVTAVETGSNFVAAKLGEAETDDEGNRRFPITVIAAENVPPGRHEVLLRIRTDDDEYGTLYAPLLIVGPQPSSP